MSGNTMPVSENTRRALGNVVESCKGASDSVADIKQCIMNGKVLQPIEYKVIVKPDLIEETDDVIKSARAAGIELMESQKEKEKNRQISGTLVAVGGKAFEDMGNPMPKVGDKVYFAKYAGIVLESDDKEDYRLCNDKDIAGILV